MGRIATEREVFEKAGGGLTLNSTLCCTKTRAGALGCQITAGYNYQANQLIEVGSFEKKPPTYRDFDILNDTTGNLPVSATVSVYEENGEIILDEYYFIQEGGSTSVRLISSKEWAIQIKCRGIAEGAPFKLQILNPGKTWASGDYYDVPGAQYTDSVRRWHTNGFIAFRLIAK